MIRRLIFFFSIISLSGCALYLEGMYPARAAKKYGCSNVKGHFKKDGTYVASGHHCPKSVPTRFTSRYDCTWVDSYYRKDGTQVIGHSRCSFLTRRYKKSSGNNCHWVNGYRRKNGSYVRGHRRCR